MRNKTLGIFFVAVLAVSGCARGRANAERGGKAVKARVVTVEHKQLRREIGRAACRERVFRTV